MKPVRFKIIEKARGFKVILNGIKYPRKRGGFYLRKFNGIPLHSTRTEALEHATQDYFSDNVERDNILRDIEVAFEWKGKNSGKINKV